MEKSAQLLWIGQTECFTMSGTMMDNKPQSGLSPEPAPPIATDQPSWQSPPPSGPAENASVTAADDLVVAAVPAHQPATVARHESPLRSVFVGPNGIYPGTRWLIYLAIVFVVFQIEGWLLLSLRSGVDDLWWRMMTESAMMLAAVLPAFVMARIEGLPFRAFGLPTRQAFRRNFWVGSLWGIVSVSVLILALRFAGVFEFGSFSLHGTRIWRFAAYYAVFFLLTGLFEDFLLRGYSQWVLAQGMNFWPAAALLSLAFGAIHGANPGEAKTGLVAAGFIGFFLCLTLRRTGDLWWAIGFHMAWDWSESYLFSVPDSGAMLPGHLLNSSFHGPDWLTGGSVGPEGSYLVFAVIGALWVLFDRTYPEVRYGSTH
ncbi:MAG TPA: type II CAAX endopeptidase family protein [Terriglobales bacterium]|nr:type II CAAX endopeptidase family protein [Terriglobales bacterium]